jgi:hypothetical protein
VAPSNHPGRVIARDTAPQDGDGEVLAELPFSHDEIDELLYGSDSRPATERLDRLRELAGHLRERLAGDLADGDPGSLLREVLIAISEIEDGAEYGGTNGESPDPLDHRETLAPDSDELETIEENDEASVDDDIGEAETPQEIAVRKPH